MTEPASSERQLHVSYVTMAFPHPAEPFAASDVRALGRIGVRVSVHSLRPRHPRSDELQEQWRLGWVGLTHNSVWASASGLLTLLMRPRIVPTILSLLILAARGTGHFLRTLALVPRAVDVFATLERERPDIVHLFWGHYPTLVGSLVQRHAPHVPLSVFLGAYDLERRYPLARGVLEAADVTWTHAMVNREALRGAGAREPTMVIAYRGIDLAALPPPQPKIPGRIITVGRLIRSKGTDLVLAAFHDLLAWNPHATLVVLGDGPDRSRLEQMSRTLGVEHAVTFHGHVDHSTVLDELNVAEIMVFLSHKSSERLPNAVKEAMACRCYCVVTDSPGMTELITDRSCGVVLRDFERETVVAHVRAALDDAALRESVGEQARRHIELNFDTSETMKRYVSAWRQALESRRNSVEDRG